MAAAAILNSGYGDIYVVDRQGKSASQLAADAQLSSVVDFLGKLPQFQVSLYSVASSQSLRRTVGPLHIGVVRLMTLRPHYFTNTLHDVCSTRNLS